MELPLRSAPLRQTPRRRPESPPPRAPGSLHAWLPPAAPKAPPILLRSCLLCRCAAVRTAIPRDVPRLREQPARGIGNMFIRSCFPARRFRFGFLVRQHPVRQAAGKPPWSPGSGLCAKGRTRRRLFEIGLTLFGLLLSHWHDRRLLWPRTVFRQRLAWQHDVIFTRLDWRRRTAVHRAAIVVLAGFPLALRRSVLRRRQIASALRTPVSSTSSASATAPAKAPAASAARSPPRSPPRSLPGPRSWPCPRSPPIRGG